MTAPLNLDALQALCDAATEGPWVWEDNKLGSPATGDGDHLTWDGGEDGLEGRGTRIIETDGGYYPPRANDRAFIAAAREAMPALIQEVRRLRAKVYCEHGFEFGQHCIQCDDFGFKP